MPNDRSVKGCRVLQRHHKRYRHPWYDVILFGFFQSEEIFLLFAITDPDIALLGVWASLHERIRSALAIWQLPNQPFGTWVVEPNCFSVATTFFEQALKRASAEVDLVRAIAAMKV